VLTRMLAKGLEGKGAHALSSGSLQGLDWKAAGQKPAGSPHSIFMIVNHTVYWQEFLLARLRGENPTVPAHAADSWPGAEAPETEADWEEAVTQFQEGLKLALAEAEKDPEGEVVSRPGVARAELIDQIANHNTYHLGQVALLRRMLASWPPPCGGDTW
jgi:uncharacterized damage-inducible protein DinB